MNCADSAFGYGVFVVPLIDSKYEISPTNCSSVRVRPDRTRIVRSGDGLDADVLAAHCARVVPPRSGETPVARLVPVAASMINGHWALPPQTA